MKEFSVVPKIKMLDTAKEFSDIIGFKETDLVLTGKSVWEKYFKDQTSAQVIIVKNYGSGEPNDDMAEAIFKDITRPYDRVIGIGGGTVIDLAKLYALKKTSPVTDLFDKKFAAEKTRSLVLVPTTCGTGSEVTNISILEFISRKTKFGLADDAIYADEAYIIPQLLEGMPFDVFAASSIDALVHSAESFLSPKASPLSKMFSENALKMILSGYKKLEKCGRDILPKLLPDFALASTMAGIAFSNAGCAAVHAMSYPLGAAFHIPHGESNYAMFTGVFKKYLELSPKGEIEKLGAIMAEILECHTFEVYDEIERLLNITVLQKRSLSQYGVTKELIPQFADSVIKNQQRLLANSFAALSREDMIDIYTKLL